MKPRVVVITGASSGIGKAISQACLADGHTVVGICRSIESLYDGVIPIKCDLSNVEEISAAFAEIQNQFSQIDVLINNAGVAYLSSILEGDIQDWDTMWQVNVRALALCCQYGVKILDSNSGQIINVSSMSGHRVPPSGGFYAPTKFAVRGITDAVRAELKMTQSKLRVSSISPGFVDTPLLDDYFQGREDQLKRTKQSMKMLESVDIANSVMHIINSPLHVEHGDIQLRSVDQSI